jgi:hypothetical protein
MLAYIWWAGARPLPCRYILAGRTLQAHLLLISHINLRTVSLAECNLFLLDTEAEFIPLLYMFLLGEIISLIQNGIFSREEHSNCDFGVPLHPGKLGFVLNIFILSCVFSCTTEHYRTGKLTAA